MMACDIQVELRWLVRIDLPAVLDIEALAFEHPWCEEDFLMSMRQRNCIGMVAEGKENILGFMVYELQKSRLNVLNFAVLPSLWGYGIGRQMVEKLKNKLSQQRRQELVAEVRETNLDAQLFFKAMGFQCIDILHGHYEDEDAYQFSYMLNECDD